MRMDFATDTGNIVNEKNYMRRKTKYNHPTNKPTNLLPQVFSTVNSVTDGNTLPNSIQFNSSFTQNTRSLVHEVQYNYIQIAMV